MNHNETARSDIMEGDVELVQQQVLHMLLYTINR